MRLSSQIFDFIFNMMMKKLEKYLDTVEVCSSCVTVRRQVCVWVYVTGISYQETTTSVFLLALPASMLETITNLARKVTK